VVVLDVVLLDVVDDVEVVVELDDVVVEGRVVDVVVVVVVESSTAFATATPPPAPASSRTKAIAQTAAGLMRSPSP
jgi:hypothetical protein